MCNRSIKLNYGLKPTTGCRFAVSRSNIKWKTPDEDWMKVNIDGTVCKVLGIAMTGGLIRDKDGIWQTGFIRKISNCSDLMAEPWAMIDGLQIVWNFGFKKVILEMDSKEALQVLQRTNSEHYGSTVTSSIKSLLKRNWTVHLSHVLKEGNKIVMV